MRRFLEVLAIAVCSIFLVIGAGVPVFAKRQNLLPPANLLTEKRFEIGQLSHLGQLPLIQQGREKQFLVEQLTQLVSTLPTERIDPQLVHAFGGSLSAREFIGTIEIQGPKSVDEFLSKSGVSSSSTTENICGSTLDDKLKYGQLLFEPSLQLLVAERLKAQSAEYHQLPAQIVNDVSRVWLRALGARCLLSSISSVEEMSTNSTDLS